MTLLLGAVGFAAVGSIEAQDDSGRHGAWRLELGPYAGAYLPIGAQRDLVTDAVLAGFQVSWLPLRRFALTATYGWAATRDRRSPESRALDTFQADIGGEWRPPACYGRSAWKVVPFIGGGAGARTYDYRNVARHSKTDLAGYAAAGSELDFGGWGIRLEARSHWWRSATLAPTGEGATARNDVTIASGFSRRF